MGVFYHMGYGVARNVEKSIQYLTKSAKAGNGQSSYELFVIFSQEEGFKDPVKAYLYLQDAILTGLTFFDIFNQYFKDNYDQLSKIFIEKKMATTKLNKDNKTDVISMHEAYINELKTSFSQALGKDRLYLRPAGFIMENQIWQLGVTTKYMVNKVLRFSHSDFIKAIKIDLGPILGEVGIWLLNNYATA